MESFATRLAIRLDTSASRLTISLVCWQTTAITPSTASLLRVPIARRMCAFAIEEMHARTLSLRPWPTAVLARHACLSRFVSCSSWFVAGAHLQDLNPARSQFLDRILEIVSRNAAVLRTQQRQVIGDKVSGSERERRSDRNDLPSCSGGRQLETCFCVARCSG